MAELLRTFVDWPILSVELFGNTVDRYLSAVALFAALLVVFAAVRSLVLKRLSVLARRTKTDVDDTVIAIYASVRPPFYAFLAFYLAVQYITLPVVARKVITALLVLAVIYQAVNMLRIFIDYLLKKWMQKGGGAGSAEAAKTVSKILKGVLWAIGALLALSNLGVDISSLIAGLGIGGIAVALALQNILTDLFSSFAIYFDKPFQVGDFIIVRDKMGVVQRVGIKTTRLKALQGEEIVMSNRDLTSATIQNFKKMQERRIVFSFGVVYSTPVEKMKKIPDIVKHVIGEIKLARFDRAHFKQFDSSQLTFEVVYYIQSPEYNDYMNANQEIHLNIKKQFEKSNIEMAFPTQTIYIEKS